MCHTLSRWIWSCSMTSESDLCSHRPTWGCPKAKPTHNVPSPSVGEVNCKIVVTCSKCLLRELLWFRVSTSIHYEVDIKAIQNVENGVILGSYGSLEVTGNSAIRSSAYEFLLEFHSNYVPILHRFWDIARYWSKTAAFNLPYQYLTPPFGVNFFEIFGDGKVESLCYRMAFFAWSYV